MRPRYVKLVDLRSEAPFEKLLRGLAWLFVVQVVLGFGLAYTPSEPVESAARLRESMSFLVRLHYWGSFVGLVLGGIAIVHALWSGDAAARRKTYLALLTLVGATLVAQLAGNLLPGDANDVRTVVVEAGVAARTPFVGDFVKQTMLGGSQFGPQTFERAFVAHRALAIVVGLGTAFALIRCRGWRLSSTGVAPVAFALALALLLPSPTGAASTQADFNSQDALVSWYAWPLHGMLRAWESLNLSLGFVGTAILPGLFVATLLAPLLLAAERSRWVKTALVTQVALFGVAAIAFGGRFAPVSGPQEVPALGKTVDQGSIDAVLAAKGKARFEAVGCTNCHGIDGSKSGIGPDLSGVYRTRTRDWIKRFVPNPQSVRKGSTMPAFRLEGADLSAIVEFLVKPREPASSR